MACTLNNELFTKALIDNCGVGESELEELTAGFAELDVLRSLVIRRSVIGTGFLTYLSQTTLKIFPNNLGVLKIERCQISREATLALIRTLQEKSYIRTLALVGVNFDEQSIEELCQYLQKKTHVEHLDLSDNKLAPRLFLPILAALSTARSIKSLNLSWNLLLEKARGPQIGTYVKEERIVQYSKEPISFPPPPAPS